MTERMKPIVGTWITMLVLGYVLVNYFFGPVLAADAPSGPLMPAWASLAVYGLISVLFFDWVNQQVNAPVKAAMIMAVSQMLLVDVYYVFNGTRGVTAALASIVVLGVSWVVAGVVYGKLLGSRGA